jgi:hypothetical protein
MAADRQAVVLYDAIRYTDTDGLVKEALKGAEVTLTAEEFERLSSFTGLGGNPEPAVASPKSKDAKAAAAEAEAEETPAGT